MDEFVWDDDALIPQIFASLTKRMPYTCKFTVNTFITLILQTCDKGVQTEVGQKNKILAKLEEIGRVDSNPRPASPVKLEEPKSDKRQTRSQKKAESDAQMNVEMEIEVINTKWQPKIFTVIFETIRNSGRHNQSQDEYLLLRLANHSKAFADIYKEKLDEVIDSLNEKLSVVNKELELNILRLWEEGKPNFKQDRNQLVKLAQQGAAAWLPDMIQYLSILLPDA